MRKERESVPASPSLGDQCPRESPRLQAREDVNYFDVLPFSDTMRWLQSLWSGAPADRTPMLFSPDAVQPCRPCVGLLDPAGTWAPLATELQACGIETLDLTIAEHPPDRQRLVAIVVSVAPELPTDRLDAAIARLDADLAPQTVFDFSRDDADLRALWGSVDDVVMGGVSQSQAIATPQGMRFSGQVSTAKSGGFASIRTRSIAPALDLSGVTSEVSPAARQLLINQGIELRLTGDGNRYKFILRDRDVWDGIAHCYSFDTPADTTAIVRIPFADCVPTFRAKSVPDCPRLDGSQVAAFQFMLSKFEYDRQLNPRFQPGPFQLDVHSVAAYRQPATPPIVLTGDAATIATVRTALGDRWSEPTAPTLDHIQLSEAIAALPHDTSPGATADADLIAAIVDRLLPNP